MKNLANCTPREFLKQTYRIKKSVEKWLELTDLLNMRKNMPTLIPLKNLEGDAKQKAQEENRKLVTKQLTKNMMDMLDKAMDQYADETIEIIALCCFVEPEDADNHTMSEYLSALGDLISDEGVISFFTSLAQLDQTGTKIVSKR